MSADILDIKMEGRNAIGNHGVEGKNVAKYLVSTEWFLPQELSNPQVVGSAEAEKYWSCSSIEH